MVEKIVDLLNLFGLNFTYNTRKTHISDYNHSEDFLAYVTFDEKECKCYPYVN